MDEVFSTEVWHDEDDVFLYTAITARCGSLVQYGETNERGSAEELWPKTNLTPIPSEEMYPLVSEHLKLWTSILDMERVYIKRPGYRTYGLVKGSDALAQEFLHEIEVYEQLSTKQHRNLPQYHGCLVEEGRVVGIVLDRYVCTLEIRRDAMNEVARQKCFSEAQAAIKHLHGIGLAHNDLNPMNIMFDEKGNTVTIDFDSCAAENVQLVKGGTPGWNDGFTECSSFMSDELALKKLKEYLEL